MNIIDWIIVGIIGLSVLIGLYRGFIASVASMGGTLLSLGVSYWLTPQLVAFVQEKTTLSQTLETYLDARTRLPAAEAARSVSGLTSEGITGILNSVSLPAPLDALLRNNLENQVFTASQNVGEYVRQTIIGAALNVICYILCFAAVMILFHLVINLLKAIFRFPVLKQFNALAGGVFGFLRGALICFVAFALLPLIQTMIPMDAVSQLVQGSVLTPVFNSGSLLISIMNGRL